MTAAAAAIAAGATCGTLAVSASAAPSGPAASPLAGLTADQIAKKAATDLEAAVSYHYHGSGKYSGQTIAISMSVTHKGCTGSITYGQHGGFAIVAIGKTMWFQPNAKFWEYAGVPASELPAVQGKWLEVTGTGKGSLSATFAPFCNASKLMSLSELQLTGLIKGKTVKISGHAALQLRNSSGQESIYVSVSSKPEILRLSADGTLNFSAYGAKVTVTPPPAADVIALPAGSASADALRHLS